MTQRYYSIKRNLTRSLLIVFSVIVCTVFIVIDLIVDDWVETQFEHALLNKTNYLRSQIQTHLENKAITLDEHHLPEFKAYSDTHFYQLWINNESAIRSPSLDKYPDYDLVKYNITLDSMQLINIKLPNGLPGKASISYFVPENKNKTELSHLPPIYLTVYESSQALERLLVIVDILLIATFISAILSMRHIALSIVEKELKPLEELNDDLKKLIAHSSQLASESELHLLPTPHQLFDEIEPFRQKINHLIQTNNVLLTKEKRITSDIAHELKTPIAEIIALNEVCIQYPDDPRIAETYKEDILSIGKRMSNTVQSLLLLQRASTSSLSLNKVEIPVYPLLTQIFQDLSFKYPEIHDIVQLDILTVQSIVADRFCIETILTNLIDNALFYGMNYKGVQISFKTNNSTTNVRITNTLASAIEESQLNQLMEPLFQLDQSRTDGHRVGLGLSIVKNICDQNSYEFFMTQTSSESAHQFTANIVIK